MFLAHQLYAAIYVFCSNLFCLAYSIIEIIFNELPTIKVIMFHIKSKFLASPEKAGAMATID